MEGSPQKFFTSGENTVKIALTRRLGSDRFEQSLQFTIKTTCRSCKRDVQVQKDGCKVRDGQLEMKFQRCEICMSQTSHGQPGFIILVKQVEQVPAPVHVQPESQLPVAVQTSVETPARPLQARGRPPSTCDSDDGWHDL